MNNNLYKSNILTLYDKSFMTPLLDNKVKSTTKREKYNMFNPNYKHKAVSYAAMYGFEETLLKFKVPKKSLKRWILLGPDRKKGGGRKIKDPTMEMKLLEWYNEYILKEEAEFITPTLFKAKALELSTSSTFIASKGWMDKFKLKHNLNILKEKKSKPITTE